VSVFWLDKVGSPPGSSGRSCSAGEKGVCPPASAPPPPPPASPARAAQELASKRKEDSEPKQTGKHGINRRAGTLAIGGLGIGGE
jgi:hypothetical protein